MPTYVYRCDACQNQFEISQRMSDAPLNTCPGCEGQVRRVIHPVGVVFKGSGWYINDSRPNSKSESNAEPASAEAPKDSTSDNSSDATAATKTQDKSPESAPAKTAAD